MIPATSHRVPLSTSDDINQQMRREMEKRLAKYRHASREEIDRRLKN